jgi:hypothetical protein
VIAAYRREWIAVVLLAASVMASLSFASGASARATRNDAQPVARITTACGRLFAKDYFNGADVRIVAVRRATCATARRVLGYYYSSGAPCGGSGCTLTTPSGWSCDTNSGDVQQRSGVITVCVKGRASVQSERVAGR